MDDLISEFITETQESLDGLDAALLSFETNPNDKAMLDKIFRIMHTVKGTCGFLGLARLEKIAHTAETLLDVFRSGQRLADPADIAVILIAIDQIRALCSEISGNGTEPAGDDSDLINAIKKQIDGGISAGPAEPELSAPEPPVPPTPETPTPPSLPMAAAPAPTHTPAPAPAASPAPTTDSSNDFLRVHVDTLEELLTMVSELVLTRNQILQSVKTLDDTPLGKPIQRLNNVVSDLQDSVMKTRMQPVGNAWTKLPRIIRDIAHEQNKKIHFEMTGEHTAIDRQVLEMIKDPLLHMVRNSADHGIETPQDRIASGKNETGNVKLSAHHEGGYVVITIQDDGKGLSPEKLRAAAIKKGLGSPEDIAAMPDKQVLSFIFAPGFSTAEQVTSISGRGVGMDVVRTNIEKIGGTIDLESVIGRGTTFTIRIPLTLAIISALMIESGGLQYAVPELTVQEILRIKPQDKRKIEHIDGRPFLHYRGITLPLVPMADYLGHHKDAGDDAGKRYYIVVIRTGGILYGMIVDQITGIEEIVVKPLSTLLQALPLFSGNTIMGDGRVVLILDPVGIAVTAKIEQLQKDAAAHHAEDDPSAVPTENILSFLLFHANGDTPKAVPSFLISRIETFNAEQIEYVGAQTVMQYNSRLINLYSFGAMPPGQKIKTLIFADENRDHTFGLMIDDIIDITDSSLDLNSNGQRPGILGSSIIDGRATEIIDINHFTDFQDQRQKGNSATTGPKHILMMDDSMFFRHMLQPFLNLAGYQVTLAESPQHLQELAQGNQSFDLIISNQTAPQHAIDVPWSDIPVMTLSSQERTGRDDILSRLNAAFEKAHGKAQTHVE